MSISIDTSDVRKLSADIGNASGVALDLVRATTQKAALNIKKDMQREAAGSSRFSRIPASISYETGVDRDGVWAEIGPEIGKQQGSLAFIAYEGNVRMGPRFPDPAGALSREADAFERFLAQAVAASVL